MYRLCALLMLVASASATNYNNRILNGQPAAIQNHPYQVSLQGSAKVHLCGGALIKGNYVLTAAHCVATYPLIEKYVQAGSTDRLEGGTTLTVKRFATHPKYRIGNLDYDAAVLTLIQPFWMHPAISTIDLVPSGKKPQTGEIVTVTGWGATEPHRGVSQNEFPRTLSVVRIPVIDIEKCQVFYANTKKPFTDRMFCAGGGSYGPYMGDSGGPAVSDKRQLIGIVSWGKHGDITGHPSVFTDLSHLEIRTFIDANTK